MKVTLMIVCILVVLLQQMQTPMAQQGESIVAFSLHEGCSRPRH